MRVIKFRVDGVERISQILDVKRKVSFSKEEGWVLVSDQIGGIPKDIRWVALSKAYVFWVREFVTIQ